MNRTSPFFTILFGLLQAASGVPGATLRAFLPGADIPLPAFYATPFFLPGFGFLHTCSDCINQPPSYTPWALLAYIHSPQLEKSLLTAVQNNATAIIVVVDQLMSDTRLVSHYVMKHALNDAYFRRLLQIPVATIEKAGGDELVEFTRTLGKVPVYITPKDVIRNESVFLLLLAISIVLFIICIFGFQICGKKNSHIPVSCVRSPYQLAVSKIPTQELRNAQDPTCFEENKCAVCIEGFQVKEIISYLPCSHIFHKECIEPWLLAKRLCPMCKMDVIKFYGPINMGSEESIVDIPLDESIIASNMQHDSQHSDSGSLSSDDSMIE